MKSVKKILAMCLAIMMIVSCIPAAHAADVPNTAIDLDAKGSLVIWHALPSCGHSPADTLSRMLSLARLEALDVHRAP